MFVKYNPNPTGRNVDDCTVRALAKALNTDWETAYTKLAMSGFLMGDLMNGNSVLGAILRQNGFYRQAIPNKCPDCYTAKEFTEDYPIGTYVLGFGTHVATVVDGNLYDSWDSSNEIPQYFWYKKEGY